MPYMIDSNLLAAEVNVPPEKNLLEDARYLGVGLVSICGGFGKCKACKIRLCKARSMSLLQPRLIFSLPNR
jgi:ferredoxin